MVKTVRKTRVRRVGVLSVAVIYSVIMAAVGLVLGIIYALIISVAGIFGGSAAIVAKFTGGIELELE